MSLLLAVTFLMVVVAGRIIMQYRLTGNHGVRLASFNAPLIEILPGSIFILTIVASTALTVLHAVDRFSFELEIPYAFEALGAIVGLCGVATTSIAQQQMRESWRIGLDPSETTNLVTHGLYARSRNPIFFGILLYWFGLAVTFPHPVMWAMGVASWLSIETVVRRLEEPYLLATHGETYATYRERTNRYLPV